MRPRIEGIEEGRLLVLVNDLNPSQSPTMLLNELINKHYESIYPGGEEEIKDNDNTKEMESAAT